MSRIEQENTLRNLPKKLLPWRKGNIINNLKNNTMDDGIKENELETTTTQKINSLHESSADLLNQSLEKAIEIGGILSAKKAELPTCEFNAWVKNYLTFTDRTVQGYIKIFTKRDHEIWQKFFKY
jgi:hypothetical protein